MKEQVHFESSLPNLKETEVFARVLAKARQALESWYPLNPQDFPGLTADLIKFLPEEEFLQQADQSHLRNNLLIMALLNLGVKREEIFTSLAVDSPIFIRPSQRPPIVYVLGERFGNLGSADILERELTAVSLGVNLIEINLILLPDFREIDGEYWREKLKERIERFFRENTQTVSPERRQELETAREIFDFLADNDPSLKFLAKGAEIIAFIKQGQEEQPLLGLGRELNRQVGLLLSYQPKRTFISQFLEYNPRLQRFTLERLKQRMKELGDPQTEEFLRRLKLGAYLDLFREYRQSQIPQRYLERLKAQPKLGSYPLE